MNTATEPETSSPPSPFHGSTTLQTETPQHQTEVFEQLRTYPFTKDREFAAGLAIILGHPETPASEEEIARDDDLVLQAKCYYFTRKKNLASPLNIAAFKSWLETRPRPRNSLDESQETSSFTVSEASSSEHQVSKSTLQEPTYPTSFAHIVELITTGQPIPGIQEIPDTLLTGQGAPSAKPRRLKPWESEETT
ncbi:hypothetical protein ASPSYDRAFT_162000 [Aspergillus sydowii CBS 593.65]|uniref:Uncharacterized protein n=1 Tax=Aspergillus sydowii CBS 593.65 TaxID=1036612 RepID=A0A1L9T3M9_9EURO|nr:uncharacterized protein ASPSYDRAFT_162000 [Aspergillus sydowii CBS 593.65]OJJ53995.1 hypothetical protein ASPSYDRAFT_162000 [Aspergillus sydowii CBS 593.65]